LDIRKNVFTEEWSSSGTGCPGQWWSHHPWRGSKNRVDVALQDMVEQAWWGWVDGWT